MGTTTGLAKEQRDTLAALRRAKALERFYLAGGSAVAFHLGHRRSNDLDLFSASPDVDLDIVLAALMKLDDLEVVSKTDATIEVRLGGTAVDIVRYPYAPLESPDTGPEDFLVAGFLDLATMKLAAITSRGIRRDFWDLHELLAETTVTVDGALDGYVRRFGVGQSDLYHVMRSLTYFDDAEKDEVYPTGLTTAHWHVIKEHFRLEAPRALRRRTAP